MENEISYNYNSITNEALRCETVDYQNDIKKWMEDAIILDQEDGSIKLMFNDQVSLAGSIEVMNFITKKTGKKTWTQFYDRKIEITPISSTKKEKTIISTNNQLLEKK